MQTGNSHRGTVADAQRGNWVDRFAPDPLKPYFRLARYDRPIGFWLLFWPCAFAVGLSAVARPPSGFNWMHIALFLVGAVVMRGAGCTFNDIVDRNIDDKVARTRSRPLPSGQVKLWQAVAFLVLQALAGLAVLLQFNGETIRLGLVALLPVAIYPFMKRITWWPQLFLGIAFSWGALLGWTANMGALFAPSVLLYAGCILWTIGYDTIYALQDIEDDALIGVKSTARLFGDHARTMVGIFYLGAFAVWTGAGLAAGGGVVFVTLMAVPAALLAWQVVTLDPSDSGNCLQRFKANHLVGLALTAVLWAEFVF
ncbi:MAG TPA: 4-hydroxybenzoate octaprenyltransferase [Devosiaceae bacterium]